MARGLTPSANSLKIRRTTPASVASIPAQPGLPLDLAVAVGAAAGRPALQHPAELAAPRLVLEIRQVELGHRAEQADVHGADHAHFTACSCYAAKFQPVM